MPQWVFYPFSPRGDTTGDAYRRSQAGSGFTVTQGLVREAIQNSADRAKKGSVPTVTFKFEALESSGKASFVAALAGLSEILERDPTSLGLASGNCLDQIHDAEIPLRLLWVEDRGTEGLTGGDDDPEGHFYRLLKQLGGGSVDPQSGGSFGFGKSVYPSTSRVRIVIAHSLALVDGIERERIFGLGLFNNHKHNGVSYPGKAYFGIAPRGMNDTNESVASVSGEDAARLAQRLGFSPRRTGDTGTSILIVDYDPSVTAEGLADEVLTWWWPRLVDRELEVRIVQSGDSLPLRLKDRADLRPFMDAYALAIGASEASHNRERRIQLDSVSGWGMPGHLGLVLLPRSERPALEGPAASMRIARMRRTKMVIDYWDSNDRDERAGHFYGTFVLSDDEQIQKAIGYSEPSTHDRWDKSSSRIMEHPRSEDVRKLVKVLEMNLKRALHKFLGEFAEEESAEHDRPRELERMIASLLSGPGTTGGHKALPILITRGEESNDPASGVRQVWTRLRLDADDKRCEALDAVEVKLTVRAYVSAEGRPDPKQPVPLGLRGSAPSLDGASVTTWVERDQGTKVYFEIASPEDPRWTIAYQVEAAPTGKVRPLA